MICSGPGTYRYKMLGGDVDWASVSACEPSWIKVYVVKGEMEPELVEDQYVGAWSPHTWWTSNSLLGRKADGGGGGIEIIVVLGPNTKFRIEGHLEELK